MEGYSRNRETCPQLLDLMKRDDGSFEVSEEKKLELKLGPPGEDWFNEGNNKNNRKNMEESLLVHGFQWCSGSSQSPSSTFMMKTQKNPNASFLQFPSIKAVELQNPEKKITSQASTSDSANIAVPNSSQKRTAPTPAQVVGWPPIRSFRKNLAYNNSSKPSLESEKITQTEVVNNINPESCRKGLFVKINMDGIPIGRKVDLKAYDSYEKLSSAVDELFRDLLAVQRNSSATKNQISEGAKARTGLLEGSREYTLVYEDNEGDRMLVGDVPWNMFVGTVRRLRVLKSSELSAFRLGTCKPEKTPLETVK